MTQGETPVRASSALVPDWLVVLASLAWRVVALTAFVVVLWFLGSLLWTVTASIAVAIVVAAVFAPWISSLRRAGRSRNAAAAIVWTAAMASLAVLVVVLALAFVPYLGAVVTAVSEGIARLQAEVAALQIPDATWASLQAAWASASGAGTTAASSIASSIAGIATVVVLSTFLVFFFLRDGDTAWLWLFQDLSDAKRHRVTTAGEAAVGRVGGYLRGTTLLSGVIALTDLAFMVVLGVPLAAPLALLVFLSGYIPYFGGIVTTAIVLLVTYATLGAGPVVVMLALIAVRNAVLAYAVRPMVYGRTTSIHPAVVLVALPAGFQLAGVIGLFVAVPVTAVLLALRQAVVEILEPDPRPVLPGLIPAWLDRAAQWSWRLLAAFALVALAVGVFTAVPLVLIPLVLATILAATLEPLVNALMRRGRTRGAAAGIAVGGGFVAIVGVLGVALLSIADQATSVLAGVRSGSAATDAAAGGQLGLLVTLGGFGTGAILEAITTFVEGIVSVAAIVVLSTLLAFYLLRDGSVLAQRAFTRMRPAVAATLEPAARNAFEVLGGYMSGTAAISFVGAASQFVIMVVLGIPFALPVFVLSFFLCFIPYIGGFISTGIALLLTIAYGSPVDIAIVALWTLVFNIVTGNVVSPIVYGKTVHLHPAVVLVAIPAGGAIAGVLGMFFVVPVVGVIAVIWRPLAAVIAAQAAPVSHATRVPVADKGLEAGPAPPTIAATAEEPSR